MWIKTTPLKWQPNEHKDQSNANQKGCPKSNTNQTLIKYFHSNANQNNTTQMTIKQQSIGIKLHQTASNYQTPIKTFCCFDCRLMPFDWHLTGIWLAFDWHLIDTIWCVDGLKKDLIPPASDVFRMSSRLRCSALCWRFVWLGGVLSIHLLRPPLEQRWSLAMFQPMSAMGTVLIPERAFESCFSRPPDCGSILGTMPQWIWKQRLAPRLDFLVLI